MSQLKHYQHYPTLKTILIVEQLLKKNGDFLSKAQIDRLLEGRINRSTLNIVLDYLEASGKIIQSNKGIEWTYCESKQLNQLIKDAIRI